MGLKENIIKDNAVDKGAVHKIRTKQMMQQEVAQFCPKVAQKCSISKFRFSLQGCCL